MRKKQPQYTPCTAHLALTQDEVYRLADKIALSLAEESETLAGFLLICHFLTYTHESRESALCAIEKACAPFMASFSDALHTDMEGALTTARKASK